MTLFVSQRQPESVVSIMLYATIILFVSGAKKWENRLKWYILINYKKKSMYGNFTLQNKILKVYAIYMSNLNNLILTLQILLPQFWNVFEYLLNLQLLLKL